MKLPLILSTLLMLAGAARAEDIAQVLARSQQTRLASLPAVAMADPAAQTLQADFERLKHELAPDEVVELRVVDGGTFAEAIADRTVVVNAAVAALPEICRRFVIAHELGHVVQGHHAQRVKLYQRHIPGEVVQQQTDAVAGALGRDASRQAHRHEHAADGYAMRAMLAMGHSREDLLAMFFRLGHHGRTATHPGTGQRLAHLRMLDSETELALVGE